MNMDALVKAGFPPWAPSPEAHDVVVWHEYDMPTVGVFRLGTDTVLFTILGSPDERLTVWGYSLLPRQLEFDDPATVEFGSLGELGKFIDRSFVNGRGAVFAIADNLRIWRWDSMKVDKSAMETALEFTGNVRESLESRTDAAQQMSAKLAGVEAAKDEFVSA
jgi:hypothetical protein